MAPGLSDLLVAFLDSPAFETAARELSRPPRAWWAAWLDGVLLG